MTWLDQFLYDQIHMTEGERLIAYWPVWLLLIAAILLAATLRTWCGKRHR